MNTMPCAHLTRALTLLLSRRAVAAAIALGALRSPGPTAARKHHKHQHTKVKRNDFGCVDVGNFCKNDGQCCSGICQGKNGRKTCKAHDASTCRAGLQEGFCSGEEDTSMPCLSSAGEIGQCDTTTGNAAYCTAGGNCSPCAKDADCVPFCGPQAACILCPRPSCIELFGTATACVGPSGESCTFPAL